MNIHEIYTPAILLNLDYMEHNLKKYCDAAAAHGKQIWPMIKTHKSTELARLQTECGCTGFLCGTLDEAEAMAADGAKPPSSGSSSLPRCAISSSASTIWTPPAPLTPPLLRPA